MWARPRGPKAARIRPPTETNQSSLAEMKVEWLFSWSPSRQHDVVIKPCVRMGRVLITGISEPLRVLATVLLKL